MKLFCVFYDDSKASGEREFWNCSYTPLEIFTSKDARDRRVVHLKMTHPSYEFEPFEMDTLNLSEVSKPSRLT